ncbi:rps6 protein kinase [Stylonychia lemnae]|uniref:Rps6 protein kinase n=1 Tax=Stylonychia lemnae TaxID=5949 RepID=A0A078A2F8_STYLE|nr:rps6 protein kinase [Stylonychia lemnae]|eukprot:CDW75713.1 rps6 protein kinase [Stylonychia lemnae]
MQQSVQNPMKSGQSSQNSDSFLQECIKENYFSQSGHKHNEKNSQHINANVSVSNFIHNQSEQLTQQSLLKTQDLSTQVQASSKSSENETMNNMIIGQECGTVGNNVEDGSVKYDSDENSNRNKQQNTDEDTKATSEEDSPPPYKQTLNKTTDEAKLEEETKSSTQEYDNLIQQSLSKTGKISKDDFNLIQVIGTGSYGKVLLVKKKQNGKLYAMKVLKKKQLRKQRQVKNTWTERMILEKINHPFIVKMNFAFQNEKKLFLVLDYCPGGELFFYISQIGRFKEQSAKFYAANILLALECLHQNDIIYRDLKPENILIDRDGFAKLTDFGLSKDNFYSDSQTNSFCGTAEYLAPEVLNKKGYNFACDWWSFGCVVYEMLSAIPPFYSKKRSEIYDKIRFKNPNFYHYHSKDAMDLISRLLEKDPSKRLGSIGGAQEIKEHEFFSGIDWDKMMMKQVQTPYKPLLDRNDDTKHFDQEICNIPIDSPPCDSFGNQYNDNHTEDMNDFDGFSFVAQTLMSANDNNIDSQLQ